jgi:uncharacterized protein (TIGR03435 family)
MTIWTRWGAGFCAAVSCAVLPGQAASAQTPTAPKFEVASVKPCKAADDGGGRGGGAARAGGLSPDRLDLPCQTVMSLIELAYVRSSGPRIAVPIPLKSVPISGGPPWIGSDRYEIDAKAEGAPGQATMRGPMLQALLEDRFQLKIHREAREVPIYALTVAKGGPKLLQAAQEGKCVTPDADHPAPPRWPEGPPRCGIFIPSSAGQAVDIFGVTIADLCRIFSTMLDRNVVDQTAIAGTFDIHLPTAGLERGPSADTPGAGDPAQRDPADSMAQWFVVAQKLGLKLDPAKGPGEFLIIDRVERPSGN